MAEGVCRYLANIFSRGSAYFEVRIGVQVAVARSAIDYPATRSTTSFLDVGDAKIAFANLALKPFGKRAFVLTVQDAKTGGP